MTEKWVAPVDHKDKIAHTRSYPLGAEAISTMLLPFAEREQCRLEFYERSIFFQSEFRKTIKSGHEVVVFSLEWGFRGEGIKLSTYSVPATLKQDVKARLLALLPGAINTWFATVLERRRRLDVYVNMETGRCRVDP